MQQSKFFHWAKRLFFIILVVGCSSDDNAPVDKGEENSFFEAYDSREFQMGFTSWPYAATLDAVASTDAFIAKRGDIYCEHIDSEIPWNAWLDETELPSAFTEMVNNRVARRASGNSLTLSISLLDIARTDLMPDYDGNIPIYENLDDTHIADAFHKHVDYLVERLTPEYLVIAVEADGLLKNAPEKWEAYKSLITEVKGRIKSDHPSLPISESMMLHNFYKPDYGDAEAIVSELTDYMNSLDFAAISFYPFLKGLKNKAEFQAAFDFLHSEVNVPIALAETGHLSEDLNVQAFDISIPGNQSDQNDYMQTLLVNAQEEDYEYVIWWTHRDYEPLWETFPEDLKDLGSLWLSNGIIDEDGTEKEAFSSWEIAFEK